MVHTEGGEIDRPAGRDCDHGSDGARSGDWPFRTDPRRYAAFPSYHVGWPAAAAASRGAIREARRGALGGFRCSDP
jgi:hypothetical protein